MLKTINESIFRIATAGCIRWYHIAFLLTSVLCFPASGQPSPSNFIRAPNGQKLFMSGANIAWCSYANDLESPDLNGFKNHFKNIHKSGGNSARWWLFTDGSHAPAWDGSGKCTGPGSKTIQSIRSVLDAARDNYVLLNLCLFSFQMPHTNGGKKALQDTTYTRAFIDNALVPMVRALKGHPALLTWEIFNEAEGMCPDFGGWGGWDNKLATMQQCVRFMNLCAGAIHREDPKALVSSGSWSPMSVLDINTGVQAGFTIRNWYKDSVLIAAGNDPQGTLDYYQIHYYDRYGHPEQVSPFTHANSYWKLDKPVLIAEFFCETNNGVPAAQLYTRLIDSGYAGAWSWAMSYPSEWPWSTLGKPIEAVAAKYPASVAWDPNFSGVSPFKEGSPCPNDRYSLSTNRASRVHDIRGRVVYLTTERRGNGSARRPFGIYLVRPGRKTLILH